MSTRSKSLGALSTLSSAGSLVRPRTLALTGVALLMAAYYSTLYHFIDVTASPVLFLLISVVTLVAATALSRMLRPSLAVGIGVVLLFGGLTVYVFTLPNRPPILPLLSDAIGLATGRSVLQITNVDIWVMSVAPGPLFLTWYFALRRWYASAVAIGGGTLGFLVLTGDAGVTISLLGVAGAIVALGLGDVERRGDTLNVAEPLAVFLAAMILFSMVVTVVPTGTGGTYGGSGLQPGGGGIGGPNTVEASLLSAGDQLSIQGSISLSPEVRFEVESTEGSYWRVSSYDRYTGSGWVKTGGTREYDGNRLRGPPGDARTIEQTITAKTGMRVLPAAWRPVHANTDFLEGVRVSDHGDLELTNDRLTEDDSYTVRSRVPVAAASELRTAVNGTSDAEDYPDGLFERYTRVPASTPDRVAQRTDRITANANNSYDTARVIERWLQRNKAYSLDVDRPDGNVADEFLFEMNAGYCTYFATTMVTMLRSQDIPARFVVGYTPGERTAQDEWVVRGYDAHAWVEVYFPEVGWVRFDPTPAGPREQAEQQRLAEARESNATGVDTNDTLGPEWTPTPTPTPAPLTTQSGEGAQTPTRQIETPEFGGVANGSGGFQTPDQVNRTAGPGEEGGFLSGLEMPSREQGALGSLVLLGFAVGLRRLGVTGRVYRTVWLRYQTSENPETDAERAFERMLYVLERDHRDRRTGETPRQYLDRIGADDRARRVAHIRERARYADGVSRTEADEAMALVNDIVRE